MHTALEAILNRVEQVLVFRVPACYVADVYTQHLYVGI